MAEWSDFLNLPTLTKPAPAGGAVKEVSLDSSKPATGASTLQSYTDAVQSQQAVQGAADQAKLEETKRQAEILETKKAQTLSINDASRASAAATRSQQLAILAQTNSVVAKGQRAMQLSDSQNPMDHLQLWLLQHSDPEYTRQGNVNRLSYLTSAAQALGVKEQVVQEGFTDQVNHLNDVTELQLQRSSDRVSIAQTTADIGQRKIDAFITTQHNQAAILATQNQMQQSVLVNLDSTQTQSALDQALKSPDGTVNIGGVTVTSSMLQDRVAALQEREYNQEVAKNTLRGIALSQIDASQIDALQTQASQQGYAVVNGQKISLAEINARKSQLLGQTAGDEQNQLSIANNKQKMLELSQEKILNTMTLPELQQIQANNNTDSAGVIYDGKLLANAVALRKQADDQQVQNALVSGAIGDPVAAAAEARQYYDSIKADPASPLAKELQRQKNLVNVAAGLDLKDPNQLAAFATTLQASRDTVEKAIDTEAKRLGLGDKAKTTAIGYQLRNQPIPQSVIEEALVKNISSGKPVNDWIGPQNAGVFLKAYNDAYTKLQSENIGVVGVDKSALQLQAAQLALTAVKQNIMNDVSDSIMAFQLSDTKNPLNQAAIKGPRLLTMMHAAELKGGEAYLQANTSLDDADKQAIRDGKKSDPAYLAAQTAAFLQELDKIKPGLAQRYVEYWSSKDAQDMITLYGNSQSQVSAQSTFSDLTNKSLILPDLPGMRTAYATSLAEGENILRSDQLAKEHAAYVTFGASPEVKQVYLLQSTPGLTDYQKQQAYSLLIKPLVQQANAQHMGSAEAAKFIETSLASMKPDDPETKQILKAVLNGRSDALKAMDNFINLTAMPPMLGVGNTGGFMARQLFNAIGGQDMALNRVEANYDWYQQLQKQGQ